METEDDINEVFSLDPNLNILGSRPRVWFYYLAGETKKEKGFKYWMKYKLGEKPVFLSELDIPRTRRLIGNRLEANGFFQNSVDYEIDSGKHHANVKFTGYVGQPYRYDSLAPFVPDSLEITRLINSQKDDSVVMRGDRYDFEVLQEARVMIEHFLRQSGYYFFDDRYVLFEADTTNEDGRVIDVFPTFKKEMPPNAYQRFRISEVNVYADYDWTLTDSTASKAADTVSVENVNYISSEGHFRPEIIVSHMRFRPGDIYNRERELSTLNRMIQLDVFQYLNLNFVQTGKDQLRADLFLAPSKKKSVRVTLEGVSTSNNFVGPHLTGSFFNRNFLGGAERFEFNLTTGYEWQFGGGQTDRLTNYEVGAESVLTVPRLISPFKIDFSNSRYIPLTKFKAGLRFQRRVRYYQMNSFNINYGFEWRWTSTKLNTFYPEAIKYIKVSNKTEEFDSLLSIDPYLQRSFDDQFILGSSYGYYFSSQENPRNKKRRHNYYFNGNLDLSGNLLHLSQNLLNAPPTDSLGNYTIFGQTYSQFVRASVDFRHYWDINKKSRLVARFMTGAGYSFGNSVTLPYSMQFATGGANSLRAFRARSVGPGNFVPSDTITFIDQTGDIKLEMNLEYRFDILGALKGAVYIDAGNIWTFREDPNRPGGKFNAGNVIDELAVGTGFGVRYDFQFFVIRLDMGLPIKLAYQYTDENGEETNFPIQPWDRSWRKRYMVWNLAIGYPF